jgi:hypothetical protein
MSDHKSLYLGYYKSVLQDIQHFIDEKVKALDVCAQELQGGAPGSDLSGILKQKDDLETLRATSTQQLVEIREHIDKSYESFIQMYGESN